MKGTPTSKTSPKERRIQINVTDVTPVGPIPGKNSTVSLATSSHSPGSMTRDKS